MRTSFQGLQLGCLSYLQFSAALQALVLETYHQETSLHILLTLVPPFPSYMLGGDSRSRNFIHSWNWTQTSCLFGGRMTSVSFSNPGCLWTQIALPFTSWRLAKSVHSETLSWHFWGPGVYDFITLRRQPVNFLRTNSVASSQSSVLHACTLFETAFIPTSWFDQLTWWLLYKAESLYTGKVNIDHEVNQFRHVKKTLLMEAASVGKTTALFSISRHWNVATNYEWYQSLGRPIIACWLFCSSWGWLWAIEGKEGHQWSPSEASFTRDLWWDNDSVHH